MHLFYITPWTKTYKLYGVCTCMKNVNDSVKRINIPIRIVKEANNTIYNIKIYILLL